MVSDQWRRGIAPLRSWWHDLERDWQSVVVGTVIVALSFVPDLTL